MIITLKVKVDTPIAEQIEAKSVYPDSIFEGSDNSAEDLCKRMISFDLSQDPAFLLDFDNIEVVNVVD